MHPGVRPHNIGHLSGLAESVSDDRSDLAQQYVLVRRAALVKARPTFECPDPMGDGHLWTLIGLGATVDYVLVMFPVEKALAGSRSPPSGIHRTGQTDCPVGELFRVRYTA